MPNVIPRASELICIVSLARQNETKERIAKLMEEDMGAFPEELDYASSIDDLTGGRNDDLCATAVFEDFHITYTARKLNALYIF